MPDDQHPIWTTLDHDHHNVGESRKLLETERLMSLREEITTLLNSLPREVEAHLRSSGVDPFARSDASGNVVEAWDFILRGFMLQSAGVQFLYAVAHLLRGHSLEIFGHARTMIENAGIAYLSKSEPDLGGVYLGRQPGDYRARTTSARILPKSDPLTSDLSDAFAHASQIFHSNFLSIAGRIHTDFKVERGKRDFYNEMKFHDIDPDDPTFFLRNAGWLIRTASRVLRLFASAFSLPDCVWYRRLEQFERSMMAEFERLRPRLSAAGTKASGTP